VGLPRTRAARTGPATAISTDHISIRAVHGRRRSEPSRNRLDVGRGVDDRPADAACR
jgi:hypothetical protein